MIGSILREIIGMNKNKCFGCICDSTILENTLVYFSSTEGLGVHQMASAHRCWPFCEQNGVFFVFRRGLKLECNFFHMKTSILNSGQRIKNR